MQNTMAFTRTILAPTGVSRNTETPLPRRKHPTEITEEPQTTPLKERNTRIAESAGKIIIPDISRVPIMRIPITTVSAVSIAVITL